MFITYVKNLWKVINKTSPETRSLIIIILFGYVLYNLITDATKYMIGEKFQEEFLCNKKAEKYSMETSVDINNEILLIAEKDKDAFDVLLLNYHNNTQSLQGYKYLYLSCLTEAPKCLDTLPVKNYWNKIDYIYYADELSKIHTLSYIQFDNIDKMELFFPKLHRLVKSSDAQAATFFTIEGHDTAIGLVVILYKDPVHHSAGYHRNILPCIQRLAILLDYDNIKK